MIYDFDEFELALKKRIPEELRIVEKNWFQVKVVSNYKDKKMSVLILKDNKVFETADETMTNLYNRLMIEIEDYYYGTDEGEQDD